MATFKHWSGGGCEANDGVMSVPTQLDIGGSDIMTIGGTPVTSQIAYHSNTLAVGEAHTHSNTAGAAATFYGARSRGTDVAQTVVQSGDLLRIDAAVGFDGTDYELAGYQIWSVSTTPGNNNMPGKWSIYTTPDASATPTLRMSIDHKGLVYIADSINITGNIELGHASDTTLARSSAGNVTIEGNIIYRAGGTDVPVTDGGTGASTAAGARVALLPALTGNASKKLQVNAGETDVEWVTVAGGGDLLSTNNLSDVASAATSRTNLGLGTIATQAANNVSISGGAITGITDLAIADGGTGSSTADGAIYNLINGATTRTPTLTDYICHRNNSSSTGGSNTFQTAFNLVNSMTAKTAPVEADELILSDSAASNVAKKITTNNLQKAVSGAIANGSAVDLNINSTSVVNATSCTNTVAAGDTFAFDLHGYILNNSGGARTYTVRITIGATTFDLVFDGTVATSTTNLSYLRVLGYVGVISSSKIVCTINVRRGAPAAAGTAQSNVLAQDRNIARNSTNNETGSKTIAIGMLSDSNTATQVLSITRARITKGVAF